MTAPLTLPEPVRLDPFRAGAIDVRGIDLSGDLTALQDSINRVESVVVVSRDDGAPLTPDDLSILTAPDPPYVDPTNMVVGWWQTCAAGVFANGVTVDYRITVTVVTNQARTIVVDAMQLVMPYRG